MKKVLLLVLCVMSVPFCLTARDQWSVKRAQKWEQEVGVLKGANGYYMTNPALGDPAVMKKLHELGFNSVRAWIGGNTAEDIIAALEKLLDAADDYGVTVSPVLSLSNLLRDPLKDKENEPVVKEILTDVLRHFRGNRQIVYWDLWNEPPYNPKNADVLRGTFSRRWFSGDVKPMLPSRLRALSSGIRTMRTGTMMCSGAGFRWRA